MQRKKINLKKTPKGIPQDDDFDVVTEKLNELQDGEVLVETVYISVDPYLRGLMTEGGPSSFQKMEPGKTCFSRGVVRVTESKESSFSKGDYLYGGAEWADHQILSKNEIKQYKKLPFSDDKHLRASLGVIGMPGCTAYVGLFNVGKLKDGETLVVSGAAGAVGSVVGQLAKIQNKNVKVVGICGGQDKVKRVKEFGFDEVIDYKQNNLEADLKKAVPNGVDVYFDNVGGVTKDTIIPLMNTFGRIPQCGAISGYNDTEKKEMGPRLEGFIIYKRLTIQGFIVGDYGKELDEIEVKLKQWVDEGKIKYDETVEEGVENIPKAFIQLFKGGNTGKMIVKIK